MLWHSPVFCLRPWTLWCSRSMIGTFMHRQMITLILKFQTGSGSSLLLISFLPTLWVSLDDNCQTLIRPNRFYWSVIYFRVILDGIDGKQARRLGLSGPLGELFDHGLGKRYQIIAKYYSSFKSFRIIQIPTRHAWYQFVYIPSLAVVNDIQLSQWDFTMWSWQFYSISTFHIGKSTIQTFSFCPGDTIW